jgi:hypothetical protein
MDSVAHYRQIIKNLLMPLAERRYANANITNEVVLDEVNDHYLVMSVGWQGRTKRVHGCLVHLDIIAGKVWIQRDGTEDGIGYELEAAGIPKSDIVPAFYPESVRPHTGYAVA